MIAASIAALTCEPVLSSAFDWLCKRRRGYPPAADVWNFRRHWAAEKHSLVSQLLGGRYRAELLTRLRSKNHDDIELWSARDSLVMRALSMVMPRVLGLSKSCTHLKGHGGAKFAVRETLKRLPNYRFVLKTDVKSFYASIDHDLLLDRLERCVQDRRLLNLLVQYLKRCSERGGLYWGHDKVAIRVGNKSDVVELERQVIARLNNPPSNPSLNRTSRSRPAS